MQMLHKTCARAPAAVSAKPRKARRATTAALTPINKTLDLAVYFPL